MAVAKILAALVILDVAATAVPKKLVTCPHRFICPCGTTGTNVTFCAGVERYDDVCSRWSNCRSCRDGLDVCLECLEGSGEVHCSKGRKLVRRKRASRQFRFVDLFGLPRERTETEDTEATLATTSGPLAICPDPGYDAHGTRTPSHIVSGGFRDGTRLEYGCRVGYTLVGDGNITCLVTGQWSSERPTCRIPPRPPHLKAKYCQNPGPVSNGKITYYAPLGDETEPPPSADDPELPDGSRLEYSCNDGHLLQGQSELDCQRIGEWSYDTPTCRPYSAPSIPEGSEVLFCPDPGVDPNGSREPRLAPEGGRGFPPNTMLQYFCKPGYRITGTPILFCYSYGDWSWEAPGCEPRNSGSPSVSFCPNPGPINNGRKKFSPAAAADRRRTELRRNSDDMEFPQGGRMSYMCKRGYALDGRGSITCGRNGQWSDDPPFCRRDRVFCPNPGLLHNGYVKFVPALDGRIFRSPIRNSEGEDLEYPRGSRLLYSCDHGFALRGANDITCEPTGKWSFPPPACMTIEAVYRMSCFNPGPIIDGSVRHVFPDVAVSEDDPNYPEGTRLEYECDEGYEADEDPVITCLSTGIWSSRPPVCTPDCGRSMVATDKKIVNGSQVEAGEWPWVVAIAVRRNNGRRHVVCGGALLGFGTVITAAHCLTRGGPPFELYFGKHHRENERDDDRVEHRTSDRVIIHPDFRNSTMDSDIALITFEPKIRFSPLVQPICLPTPMSTAKNLRTGNSGYVSGWGLNENQAESQELTMARLPFAELSACTESFRQNVPNFNRSLTGNMFCAGFPDARQATCKGDSGSPMVFFDPVRERFTLEGLVSFGVPVQCGHPGVYTVFTRVFPFLSWIYENV